MARSRVALDVVVMSRIVRTVCRWRALPLLLAGTALPASAHRVRAQGAPYVLDAFVVAHADDWQLFMGNVLVEALRQRQPVLVIVTSAGDAARGTEFWQTREAGAIASMQAALALAGEPVTNTRCTLWQVRGLASTAREGTAITPGRLVRACQTGAATTVFLRLPDGRPDGAGFAVHRFHSMTRLATAGYGPIAALDSSARYVSRDDLAKTVAAIISGHRRPGLRVEVRTHDPDPMTNPIDHADHRETGHIALEAARELHVPVTLYAGYSNLRRTDNLTPEAAAWKAYCFVQYDRAMMHRRGTWSAYAENAWAHAVYLSRTYARPAIERGLLRRDWP